MLDQDARVRLRAFDWLAEQSEIHGATLPYSVLRGGFLFEGERVPLLGPQGIFKPRVLAELPLSITTSPDSPYADRFEANGELLYSYRGTDPSHRDNLGLRRAMQRKTPLVYLHGVVPGKYVAAWPVFVVGDDPSSLTFRVAVDDVRAWRPQAEPRQISDDGSNARRAYVTATFRRRLHQERFRERVLRAYEQQCSLCRLRHDALLDAAHIIPDREPEGDPIVRNGLALCKLHHAAFDGFFLAVRPDYIIVVRDDILRERDGPVLVHAIQSLNGQRIFYPRDPALRPDPQRLEERFTRFRNAG